LRWEYAAIGAVVVVEDTGAAAGRVMALAVPHRHMSCAVCLLPSPVAIKKIPGFHHIFNRKF